MDNSVILLETIAYTNHYMDIAKCLKCATLYNISECTVELIKKDICYKVVIYASAHDVTMLKLKYGTSAHSIAVAILTKYCEAHSLDIDGLVRATTAGKLNVPEYATIFNTVIP